MPRSACLLGALCAFAVQTGFWRFDAFRGIVAAAVHNPLALPLAGVMLAWLAGARIDARRHRFALWALLGAVLVYWAARLWLTPACTRAGPAGC